MKFKEFLTEADVTIHIDEAVEFYLKECSDWKDVEKPLWRISAEKSEGKGNVQVRTTRERLTKSQAGTADIQAWIFEQPEWEDFPDRHKSTFCSSIRKFEISAKGEIFQIFPVNGTKLAITEDKDFNFVKIFKGDPLVLYALPHQIEHLFYEFFPTSKKISHRAMWKQLCSLFLKNDGSFNKNVCLETIHRLSIDIEPHTIKLLSRIVTEIPYVFKPSNLNVKLVTPSSIKLTSKQQEIWFEGKYLAIPSKYEEAFVIKVKQAQKQ